jgi:hypothetical protein
MAQTCSGGLCDTTQNHLEYSKKQGSALRNDTRSCALMSGQHGPQNKDRTRQLLAVVCQQHAVSAACESPTGLHNHLPLVDDSAGLTVWRGSNLEQQPMASC